MLVWKNALQEIYAGQISLNLIVFKSTETKLNGVKMFSCVDNT